MDDLQVTEEDGVTIVSGDLDFHTAPAFLETMGATSRRILDLSGVTFIDSSGLQALIDVRDALSGETLVIRDPAPCVMKLLTLVNATDWPRFEVAITTPGTP